MEKEKRENIPENKHRISKRAAVVILIVLLLITAGTAMIFASKSPDVELIDGYYVTLNDRGNYTIVGLDGTQSSTTLLVPETLGDRTVDEIAGGAFTGSRMKNFIVPTTIEYIGKNAFDGEGVFYIYMVGRKDLSGMTVDENWSGAGEVIFQDVRPQINVRPDVKEVGDFASNTSRPSTDLVIEGELPFDESLLTPPDFSTDFDTQNPSISGDDEASKKNPMERIEIVTPPTRTEYVEGQGFDNKGMLVKAVYKDGFSQLVSGYIYSRELLSMGVNTIVITYSDSGITQTAIQPIIVTKKQPIKLTIKTAPDKIKYVEGQYFNLEGSAVVAEYNNGETRIITPNYVDIPLVLNQPNIELTYSENGGKARIKQQLTVIKKVPEKLAVKTSATKTAYIEGNIFDKTGMIVEVTDNDGEKKEVTDFTYPTKKLIFGETEAELTYTRDGVTVQTFQLISVRKRLPTALEVVTPPDKTLYIEDIPFDPDGLTTRATYDNGDVEMVTAVHQTTDLVFGQTVVELTYRENDGEVKVNQPITVVKKTPTVLKVKTQPDKKTYSAGLKFKSKGMEVEALYDNGKTYPVTTYTYPNERLVFKQSNVTLTHKENGATVTTNVPITVSAQMAIYEKYYTNRADCTACSGKGNINTIAKCLTCSGTGKITEDYSCIKEVSFIACSSCGKHFDSMLSACDACSGTVSVAKRPCGICNGTGTAQRTITCTTCAGKGETGNITICATCTGTSKVGSKGNYITDVVAVDGSLPDNAEHTDGFWYIRKKAILDEDYFSTLLVKTPPTKTTYIEEEVFDPSGMVIELIPSDNENKTTVTAVYPTEELVYGQKFVTVTYTDEKGNKAAVDQPITVLKRKPTSIKIVTPPDKTDYAENMDFIPFGMKVEASYDNGKTHEVSGYTFTSKIGKSQTAVIISYLENGITQTASQPINVINRSIVKLVVTVPRYKDKYVEDEKFFFGDSEVTVFYDNGEEKVVTPTYNDIPLVAGQNKIALSYSEDGKTVTTDIPISVVVKAPKGIKIVKQPAMTNYSEGLKFNPDGMIVEAFYDNGATAIVKAYTFQNIRLVKGQTRVTISYSEKGKTVTTDVPIIVGAKMAIYEKRYSVKVTCPTCTGKGNINTIVTCSSCGGRGQITSSSTGTCGSCGGSGKGNRYYIHGGFPCYVCGGNHDTHYLDEWAPCGSCGGSGSKTTSSTRTCYTCSGSGRTGSIVTCSTCIGKGKVGSKGSYITDVVAQYGTLPNEAEHTDGFWYVLKRAVVDNEYLFTLSIKTPPTKTTYLEGQIFEPTGMVVELVPPGAKTGKVITAVYPTEKTVLGQTFITASFTDEFGNTSTANQPITVVKKSPTAIRIISPPDKTEYIENTNFVSVGMKVEATYDNGDIQEVSGFTFPAQVVLGQTYVTISYSENGGTATTTQPISVIAKTPISLKITKPAYTDLYLEDERFKLNASEVTVFYDNGEEKAITPIFNDIPLIEGQTIISLSYEENGKLVILDVPIRVLDKAPIELKVTVQPTKTEYVEEEIFDVSGMKVVALYNNNTAVMVTGYTYSNANLTLGQNKVTLSFSEHGKTVTVDVPITVVKKTPTNITITTPPTKTEYIEETNFVPDGMVVEATYSNGKKHAVTGYTFTPKVTFGQTYVTISYSENGATKTTTQAITVIKKTPTNITITTPPTKVAYVEGELFDKTGMVVKATYNNGTTAFVTPSITDVALTFGQTSVTVSYTENSVTKTATQAITVVAYFTHSDGTITGLTAEGKTQSKLTIPNMIDGIKITNIGKSAFERCFNLTSITIPSSVTSIGNNAFSECFSLNSITVDSANPSYKSIDGVLFSKDGKVLITYPCNRASSYAIQSGVTSIGDSAFYNCRNLTSIAIPSSVTSIGRTAFNSCSSLTSITIPNSVTIIGDYAFGSCTSLTSITIPSSVTSIGNGTFNSCNSLTSINIPSSVTNIGKSAFEYCTSLTSITIPSSVTSIGESAFEYCTSLTSITIPSSVTSIGESAFRECHNLTSIAIPSSITSIGGWAFSECYSLTSVNIPSGVTSIGDYTFERCYRLPSITIPNSVTSIGESAFSSCNSLTSINIPSSVTSIGESAFSSCTSLTSVTIPNSVTNIGNGTFNSCNSLTSINIPSSVTSIGNGAFVSCSSLTSINIPNSVTSIGDYAFRECHSLPSITIPNSVTSIGYWAFLHCNSLTSINVQKPKDSIADAPWDAPNGVGIVNWLGVARSAKPVSPKDAVSDNPIVTYEKWTTKDGVKQTYLADVEATSGTLPENGIHTDGYYYRKKA